MDKELGPTKSSAAQYLTHGTPVANIPVSNPHWSRGRQIVGDRISGKLLVQEHS